ncbi:uncharacterized protein LOC110976106 [Acanthaster planci]|uniref:Uncharacterized protein LOC110976106 n=1 Tax=Acanthaster planci TaxID=133434 RepID=A0A8B7XX20_ACAPL|nr:uncharacterized protein LOC110976106 [Acanthaster planci]
MSSYWKVVPTFRLARQLCRDMYGPKGVHRFFRDQYMDGVFRAWPWAVHSELHRSLGRDFNEMYKKHWEEFAKDLNDTFGVRIRCDQDATKADRPDHTAADVSDQESPSAKAEAPAESRTDHGFQVALDLSGFTPQEISVKIVGNNTLRVEARHEERTDGSHVMRNYTQEFALPADVDLDALKSSLDAEGVLNLTAPGRGLPERAVPIEFKSPETAADEDMKTSHGEEADTSGAEKPEDKK